MTNASITKTHRHKRQSEEKDDDERGIGASVVPLRLSEKREKT